MFVEIPLGTKIKGTLFDFFRRYNIIEFKSRNDQLTYHKFKSQLGRVHIWGGEHKEVADEDILNVIVSARYPRELISTLEAKGKEFKLLDKDTSGIYGGQLDLQDIVLVVCSELPVEPKYAPWLLFADPNTTKWRAAVRMMAENQLLDLLEEARRLNPKEYKAMSTEVEDILAYYYKPEEREEYLQALQDLAEDGLLKLEPEQRLNVLSKLPPEERLKGLPPQEIMRAVPVEERTKELTPEEKKRLLKQLQQELGETE